MNPQLLKTTMNSHNLSQQQLLNISLPILQGMLASGDYLTSHAVRSSIKIAKDLINEINLELQTTHTPPPPTPNNT